MDNDVKISVISSKHISEKDEQFRNTPKVTAPKISNGLSEVSNSLDTAMKDFCAFCMCEFNTSSDYTRHICINNGEKLGNYFGLNSSLRIDPDRPGSILIVHSDSTLTSATVTNVSVGTINDDGVRQDTAPKEALDIKQHSGQNTSEHDPQKYPNDKPVHALRVCKIVKSQNVLPLDNAVKHVCIVCSREFKGRDNLRTHMYIHTKVKRFKCPACEKQFSWKSKLKQHMTIHTGVKNLNCPLGDKQFRHKFSLKRHIAVHANYRPHTGVKNFGCDICNKFYATSDNLKRHLKKHSLALRRALLPGNNTASSKTGTSPDKRLLEKNHTCDVCNRAFTRKGNLKIHKLIHNAEKEIACSFCDMKFHRKQGLSYHMARRHNTEKNFICDICGGKFANLKSHQLTHSDVKPFKCDTCGHSFRQKTNLQRHQSVHTGARPITCDICNKGFSRLYMKSHRLLHSEERNFACPICGRQYTRESILKKHQKSHGGDQFYSCDKCNKRFIRLSSLEKHKLVHTMDK